MGLRDALNPCALATGAFFLLLLYVVWGRRMNVRGWGALFVLIVYAVSFVLSCGYGLAELYSYWFRNGIDAVYYWLGFVLALIGIMHLLDWLTVKRKGLKGKFFFAYPVRLSPQGQAVSKGRPGRVALICFLTVAMAVVLPVLANVWAPSAAMAVILNDLMMPGRVQVTMVSVAIYQAFCLWPLILLAWLAAWFPVQVQAFKAPDMAVSFYKVVVSAVFLSIGCSLIYLFK